MCVGEPLLTWNTPPVPSLPHTPQLFILIVPVNRAHQQHPRSALYLHLYSPPPSRTMLFGNLFPALLIIASLNLVANVHATDELQLLSTPRALAGMSLRVLQAMGSTQPNGTSVAYTACVSYTSGTPNNLTVESPFTSFSRLSYASMSGFKYVPNGGTTNVTAVTLWQAACGSNISESLALALVSWKADAWNSSQYVTVTFGDPSTTAQPVVSNQPFPLIPSNTAAFNVLSASSWLQQNPLLSNFSLTLGPVSNTSYLVQIDSLLGGFGVVSKSYALPSGVGNKFNVVLFLRQGTTTRTSSTTFTVPNGQQATIYVTGTALDNMLVHVAVAKDNEDQPKSLTWLWVTLAIVGAVVVVLLILGGVWFWRKRHLEYQTY